jgi:hypothetical protein
LKLLHIEKEAVRHKPEGISSAPTNYSAQRDSGTRFFVEGFNLHLSDKHLSFIKAVHTICRDI